jgi:hypothetical protein
MTLKKNDLIPLDDHVMRHVPWPRLLKDENENVVGILAQAFELRPSEEGLSTTWIEFFQGSHNDQISAAVKKCRTIIKVTPKSGFAIGNVDNILSACNRNNGNKKTRIVYIPTNSNKAHAEVRSLPQEDSQLLEYLATVTWSTLVLNKDIP